MLRSKISMSVSAALLLGLVSLTGCGNNDTAGNTGDNTGVQPNSVRQSQNGRMHVNSTRDGMQMRGTGGHNIDNLELNQELSDRISAMEEIDSARVMLAGNNAYVAVTMKGNSNGMKGQGTTSYRAESSTTPHNYGPTGVMSGTGRVKIGRDGMNDTGRTANGMNSTQNGSVNTVPGSTSNGPLMNSNGAKRDLDMGFGKGLSQTNTNNNQTNSSNNQTNNNTNNTNQIDPVPENVKNKIAAVVKKHNPKINAVYISGNSDFVDQANYYSNQAKAGNPIRGFADGFRNMVENIFPTENNR